MITPADLGGGNIYGKVMKQDQSPVPGVIVVLFGDDDTTLATASDQYGDYSFSKIPFGDCRLEVQLVGYTTTMDAISGDYTMPVPVIHVEVGSHVHVDLVVTPGPDGVH